MMSTTDQPQRHQRHTTLRRRQSLQEIASKASISGMAGGVAMGTNVLSMMWVRTVMKHQYANGGSYLNAFRTLYAQGGIARFYRGLPFALFQAPLCRFGDTAANTFVLTYLNDVPETADLHVAFKTCAATALASLFRVLIMPLDTSMTTMQVRGSIRPLIDKVSTNGISALYQGSAAAASASIVGHFPWFGTYNFMSELVPKRDTALGELGRRATIGFCASVVSDTCANLFWVVKVNKQTSSGLSLTYPEVARKVIKQSGVSGLFFRGLETKIFANGMQGLIFAVLWKYFEELLHS
mmetsp:Transcript_6793/g.14829  ORF Transcript_6793/g.14829 Transcript_6793/m.14829 type:complete len:296 (+) Transcript_6793:26-913(+)